MAIKLKIVSQVRIYNNESIFYCVSWQADSFAAALVLNTR